MTSSFLLILIVAVAYLATHVAFDWIARRFLIVSGAEYLVLGILLGPQVSDLLTRAMVESFAPLITLALGWIGTIIGMQFFLPDLVRVRGIMYRLAFFEAFTTLTVVGGLSTVVLAALFDLSYGAAAIPGLALGAIATVSAPSGIQVAAQRLGHASTVIRQLELTTAVDALVAILTLGLLYCLSHPAPIGALRPPTATEWAVVNLGTGVVGGTLFHLFLGAEREQDRIVISLVGAIILVSGAAAYLALSPLLTGMFVGIILANTSRNRREIETALVRGERPFYFVLLIFAGATWEPSAQAWWLVPVLLFLVARAAAKLGGARLGTRVNDMLPQLGADWGRGLLAQGGLALGLALDYGGRVDPLLANIVFTAAIVSVLLTDLSAARLVRSVLAPLVGEHGTLGPGRRTPAGGQPNTPDEEAR